ncbi:MAG: helix-turn-helix domain-containing protein [Treponema sp.]|nr:helix-turn-helix domain-containing protein [Treponema sp.]
MKQLSIRDAAEMPASDNKISIINRREIMPLLAKARHVLRHYEKAVSSCAVVFDSSGKAVAPSQMCYRNECPCRKTHQAAIGESRKTESVYVYSCDAGIVFWTSPLYHSGRYVGSLTAGQVILQGHYPALEKFNALCRDKIAEQNFLVKLKDVPNKNLDEVKALAQMLELCAEEISGRTEEPCQISRRKIWQNESLKNSMSKKRLATTEGSLEYAADGNNALVAPHPDSSAELSAAGSRPRLGLLEKERMLLAAFRRGDNETGGKILKELMGCVLAAMPGNMEVLRFRAIELMVLLSRAAIPSEPRETADQPEGFASDALLETNNRYLNRILESNTSEELIENLYHGAERMASKIFSFQGMRHASALRRAERYIWENYTRKLSLEEIAKASGLSAPYFSAIFKEEMGENLSSYLNRLRIERTITLLIETGKSLNEIAKLCGFEDQSWFSKIFKSFTGISPGKFRENGEITPWPLADAQSRLPLAQ